MELRIARVAGRDWLFRAKIAFAARGILMERMIVARSEARLGETFYIYARVHGARGCVCAAYIHTRCLGMHDLTLLT